jgi:hypothetical protein
MPSIIASILVILLLGPLVLPEGLAILGVTQGPTAQEKSLKASFPPFSLAVTDFGAYAKQASTAYGEGFPFRDSMIRASNLLRMAIFDESPSKSVIMGRDGWLFVNMEMEMEDWLGVGLYQPEELSRLMEELIRRRDWLAARGIRFLVAVAPNKSTIYGEHLPEKFAKLSSVTRLDQLASAMREAGVEFVDLRPALQEAKSVRRAFWKTDTHWNGWGAFMGSRAIVEALRRHFPAMAPLRAVDYGVTETAVPGGDLAEMLLLERELPEIDIDVKPLAPPQARPAEPKGYKNPAAIPSREMIVRETGDSSLPKAVVFRDSFASAAWPFLAERFQRSVFVWEHRFQPHIVEAEKPDVVIYEVVERYQRQLFFED